MQRNVRWNKRAKGNSDKTDESIAQIRQIIIEKTKLILFKEERLVDLQRSESTITHPRGTTHPSMVERQDLYGALKGPS
jgi:hypothetical protein